MTRVFIIRHAEAEGNLYRRGQGHFDGKITPRGRRQIEALAERFRGERIDALYSSDLSRAVDTAGAILKHHGLELKTAVRLREINMGRWEDMSWGDIAAQDGDMLYKFNHSPDEWSVEGGESFSGLTKRITSAVRELASAHDGQTIAIVSHGMAIRSMLCAFLGVDSKDSARVAHADNTAVSLLEFDGDGTVSIIYMNDNSHLGEELSTFANQSWWKKKSIGDENSLRFEPLDPYAEAGLYTDCYADAWRESHDSERGFSPADCLARAREHAARHPAALVKAYRENALAGVVEVDTLRGESEGYGWLTLCYMLPGHRGERLGVQLIGHAVSVFRRLGRSRLRLHVAAENERAVRFYKNYDFVVIGRERGAVGELLLMEKTI